MFQQRRQTYDYKKIAIFVVSFIIIFTGGFFIGSKVEADKTMAKNTVNITKTSTNQPFGLEKDCEVWLKNEGETETNYKRTYIMAGVVPNEVLNKSENEIKEYFKNEYPGKEVASMTKEEIVLEEAEYDPDDKLDTMSDNIADKKGKYAIENSSGYIALYKYDAKGSKKLVEKTKIKLESLPKTVQDEIDSGVIMETEDEAYARLEDFAS